MCTVTMFVGVLVAIMLLLMWSGAKMTPTGVQYRFMGRPRTLHLAPRCVKCNIKMPTKICPKCASCDQCRAEDKCGVCQRFQRQISLDERSAPCSACGMKPCQCPTATGAPVLTEPGVARNGVFSDPMVSTL